LSTIQLTAVELEELLNKVATETAERVVAHLLKTDDRLLDVYEASKVLGCSVSTVERWTRERKVPSHKIGKLRRYRHSELLAIDKQIFEQTPIEST
jgi:excisionase family DNA binding protein